MKKILLGLVLMAAGLFMFFSLASDASSNRSVADHGIEVMSAPVMSYNTMTRVRGGKSFSISVQFLTGKGEQVSVFKEVSSTFVRDFKPGMRLKLRYLPEDPQQAVIVGEEEAGMSLTTIAGVILVVWGGLMVFGGLAVRKQ